MYNIAINNIHDSNKIFMSLNTSLSGRLRNTNLPKSHVLLPIFEAVVNSIHSIDERINKHKEFSMSDATIRVIIKRSSQSNLYGTKPEITGFKIIDNGIGFNNDNYNSFQTLDSEYKISKGCRGMGRLLWLKVFETATIKSIYKENNNINERRFKFNAQKDIHDESNTNSQTNELNTSVSLNTINKAYLPALPKTTMKIAKSLLEHCLWYFLREGSAPNIYIIDTDETISLNKEYESYMINASHRDTFSISNHTFELTHVKLKINSSNQNTVSYSAANRLVKSVSLKGKIPGLYGTFKDENEEFNYMCFVSSDYLTNNVTPERLDFNIPEKENNIFEKTEVSFEAIQNKVFESIKSFLEIYLSSNKELGKKKVEEFINEKAPRYRPLLNRLSEDDKVVNPEISDKDLELKLHEHLVSLESELISEGHNLMIPKNIEDVDDYSTRIESYLSKASDLKQSDLANHVTHRKVILDLLTNALKKDSDNKYVKEDVIHKLIIPMQKDSTEIFEKDSNLWIIDESLSFHNYLASDKTLKSMPITDSTSTKEPDIVSFNIYNNPLLVANSQSLPLASINVIEIKRPMRNDMKSGEDKDPIEQSLGYLRRIRKGGVKTNDGRPIPNSEDIPGFCYILCDLTPSIIERCDYLDLTITADKMGYFGYHQKYNAYIEIISFDRLINMAKKRNKAFFDKLGLPSN